MGVGCYAQWCACRRQRRPLSRSIQPPVAEQDKGESGSLDRLASDGMAKQRS
jgi:hypothetical protein